MNRPFALPEPAARRPGEIGTSVLRVEDPRLLLGQGRFVADLHSEGQLHCVFVRSPHAHAAIEKIDATRALMQPGVVAVLTGGDMAADRVGPMTCLWAIRSHDGSAMAEPPRWALARERVRHVGEPIAVVIAETSEQAIEAAEAVSVEYAPLPAVVDARAAMAAQAPQLHEAAPQNVCFRWSRGDKLAVEQQLRSASHVTSVELVNNRLVGAAIEPRAVLAVPAGDGLVLYSSTQVPHHIRRLVTEQLGMAQNAIRVVAPDVGGGFGYKGKHYPEEVVLAWAARGLQRPVKWVASRSESFVSDYQGRDHFTRADLAVDAEGRFQALRVETDRQSRRLRVDIRRGNSERDLQLPAGGRLPHSGSARGMHRSVHQYRADGCLSRRRPAGGVLRAGTACRPGRAGARHRSRRDTQAQPHPGAGHALQDADRPDLRLRRLSESVLARPGARRLSRLRQAADRLPPSAECCAVSASHATWNHRAWRRRGSPGNSARVPASSNRPGYASTRTAA